MPRWQTSWIFFFTHLDHESIKKPYTYELFQVLYTTYETVYSTNIWGASKSMTKDEYFKLCTALVQEQVYAWGIASSFVCLGSPPGMADAMLLKPNWSIPRGISIWGGGGGGGRGAICPPPKKKMKSWNSGKMREEFGQILGGIEEN